MGLSYDLLTGLDPTQPDTTQTPWTLTLHQHDYPKEYLLRLPDKVTLREYWMHQNKEASFSRDGNANKIMNLSNAHSQKMWDSLVAAEFGSFWAIMGAILPRDPTAMRSVPIKVYLPMSNQCIAAIVRPTEGDGPQQTIGQSLHAHLPSFFPSATESVVARPILHGMEVPLAAGLCDLYYMAMYPDGFLHMSLVMINTK